MLGLTGLRQAGPLPLRRRGDEARLAGIDEVKYAYGNHGRGLRYPVLACESQKQAEAISKHHRSLSHGG